MENHRRTHRHVSIVAGLLIGAAIWLATSATTPLSRHAQATAPTISADSRRSGWDGGEPTLKPEISRGQFGALFSVPVTGQVYAQPLVYDDPVSTANSRLIVATEEDWLYGLDPASGAQQWAVQVGIAEPSGDGRPINCADLAPYVGITSTPVLDTSDPANPTVYFVYRTWDGSDPASAQFLVGARNARSGAAKAGFPIVVQGSASNDAQWNFDPVSQAQRPGLLLLNGRIYFAFASFCDNPYYTGWVGGIGTDGQGLSLWTTEPGQSAEPESPDGGIWQSGGGLASDGTSVFAVSGNGAFTTPLPAAPVSGAQAAGWLLSNSVMRLRVNGGGTLNAADFFTPIDTQAATAGDLDLGSGGPVLLPDGFAAAAVGRNHPHLYLSGGKTGEVFLLDSDRLGGFAGTDATSNVPPALATATLHDSDGSVAGIFGHAAVWPGDGGHVYLTTAGRGNPGLAAITIGGSPGATVISQDGYAAGFGEFSGSPVVTSDGPVPGSALVWVLERPGIGESGGQLRAYDAVPQNGVLHVAWSYPIGNPTKFSVPATDNGRVFVGTEGGAVFGFGPVGNRYQLIHALYHDLLGRAPDVGGLAGWEGFLDSGGSPSTLAAALIASDEYRDDLVASLYVGGPPSPYPNLLRRPPDPAGIAGWSGALATGASNERVIAAIASSDEYYTNRGGGNDPGYITALFADLLHRTPDAAGWAISSPCSPRESTARRWRRRLPAVPRLEPILWNRSTPSICIAVVTAAASPAGLPRCWRECPMSG